MQSRSGWTLADVWERVSDRFPDEPALIDGSRLYRWREFERRAEAIARILIDTPLTRQANVALYLRNCPEYMESMFGLFKAGLVPVNTNFRYRDDELAYLWTDCEAAAVVFAAEFTEVCGRVRHRVPSVKVWLRVGSLEDCPDWAVPYPEAASGSLGRVAAAWGRSGDDIFLLYTGGTTGTPKGVMWRQDDLFQMLEEISGRNATKAVDIDGYVDRIQRRPRVLPIAPLMHGTACWFAMSALSQGGCVVTVEGASVGPERLLNTIVDKQVKGISVVGDPIARPILEALDGEPHRWDLSGLRVVSSSGAIFRAETKQRLLQYAPRAVVVDGLGSSESGSLATTVTRLGSTEHQRGPATAQFRLGPRTRVIDDLGRDVVPGEEGRLAVAGYLPIGYYRDPEKTANTFIELDGIRYAMAGDRAVVNDDATITLLGRGSGCINSGGEKVYPEEVEEVLKSADSVRDAAVVGIPDERFGEVVAAVVQPEPGLDVDTEALIGYVRERLAAYKTPKLIVTVETNLRSAAGKLDYPQMRRVLAGASSHREPAA